MPGRVDSWVAQALGVSALLVQSTILAVTGLVLKSTFRLRPGSLTLVFVVNGLLVVVTKTHFYLLPAAVAAGLAGGAGRAPAAPPAPRPAPPLLAAVPGAVPPR